MRELSPHQALRLAERRAAKLLDLIKEIQQLGEDKYDAPEWSDVTDVIERGMRRIK